MYEIGKGFEISNILNIISASNAYIDLSYCDEAIKITGIIANHMPANSSITIDLWSFSIRSLVTMLDIKTENIIIKVVKITRAIALIKWDKTIKMSQPNILPTVPGPTGTSPRPVSYTHLTLPTSFLV